MRTSRIQLCLVFAYCVTSGYSLQCVTRDFCSCEFDDGRGIVDLGSLGRTDGTPLFLDVPAALDSSVYSYNPCYPFIEGMCTDVAICKFSYLDFDYFDLGAVESAVFSYDGQNVVATYKSQDGTRSTDVSLVCDPASTSPYLQVMGEESPLKYTMTVTSASVCPFPPHGTSSTMRLSTGTVLLIIFFAVLFLYLVTGLVFARVKRRASGKELIPNLQFWRVLPGLIRDGCVFTAKLTCCRKRQSYAPI